MVRIIVEFIDPELDREEKELDVTRLINQLKKVDEIDAVSRITDPNPPIVNESLTDKSFTSFLIGLLSAEFSIENARKVLDFLANRLQNKPIKFTVETQEKSLEIEVYSSEDLNSAMDAVKKFLADD